MTNPTPAPDDGQAHDAARAIVAQVNLMSNTVGQAREIRAELTVAISAALARERREAIEMACRAVCGWCSGKHSADYLPAEYLPIPGTYSFGWVHHYKNGGANLAMPCDAAPIRAAAIEALRDKP